MRLFPHKATHDSGKERTTVDTQPATRPDSHTDHTEKSDTEKSHTDTSPSEVVRWFLTAFQNRDIETTLLLVDPSAEVNIYSVGVRAGGVDQLRNLLEQTRDAFPDLLLTVRNLIETGPVVTAELKVEGTQAADYLGAINQEKHLDVDEAWRFTVSGDRITGVDAYWCQNQLYRRLAVKRLDHVAIV